MPFDKFVDIDKIDDDRRTSVMKSIRTINIEELKKLAEEIFHDTDEPWRDTFFRLVAENPPPTFHHAVTHEGVIFLYCHAEDKGLWFLPGSGKGPLSPGGRQMMKEVIDGGRSAA